MELKHDCGYDIETATATFNRTRMELKQKHLESIEFNPVPFNRTRMELKPYWPLSPALTAHLLIVPEWN